ncbi:MAG: hypothetical protein JO025_03490 [Verrucomicrobia bacterium]|nr:hypothetical protein [Verrucomicrobiota bacterium]
MNIDVSENGAESAPDGSSLVLCGHSEWGLIRITVKYAHLLNSFGLCDASDSQRWSVWGSRGQNDKAFAQIAIRLYEAGRFLATPLVRTIDIPADELRRSKSKFDATSVLSGPRSFRLIEKSEKQDSIVRFRTVCPTRPAPGDIARLFEGSTRADPYLVCYLCEATNGIELLAI